MYKTFIKHAKKVTNSEAAATRTVLQGIMHYENGDAAVTDSHRLYYVKGIHDKSEALLSAGGKKVEGRYPEITRLFPNGESQTVKLDVKEMIKGVDIILTAAKVTELDPRMDWEGNLLTLKSKLINAKYELPFKLPIELLSNARYWLEALKLFKAFKYKEIELNVHGAVRPFVLKSGDDKLFTLIMPIRRY